MQRSLRGWIALALAFPLRAAAARAALAECGGDAAAAAARGPVRPAARDVEDALRTLGRHRAVVLAHGSPRYPALLAALPDAPAVLFVQGDVAHLALPAVAIVGARAPTAYGLSVARMLAAGIARAGLSVVSGLARGIDGVAHRAALEAGGVTTAVQGCGPDRVYPPSHRGLAADVAARGALVTELPPGAAPLRHHFPLRNRLISGLARAVVVVEARERSGSLGTALHAAEQDREVFAVPGPIDAATSAGTNRLLRDGAHPCLGLDDVLQRLGVVIPSASAQVAVAQAGEVAGLGPEARALIAQLAREPATRDELAQRLGRPVASLEAPLLELELAGAVAEDRSGRLRAQATEGRTAPPGGRPLCCPDR